MTPKRFMRVLFEFFFSVILIGLAVLVYSLLLTGCAKRDPFPVDSQTDWPAPGDPEVIMVGDVSFVMPTETPAHIDQLGIAAWVRYDPNPNRVQEIGAEISLGGYALQTLASVCMDGVCQSVGTDMYGTTYAKFEQTWEAGAVPWSVCVVYEAETKCLAGSFMATEWEE